LVFAVFPHLLVSDLHFALGKYAKLGEENTNKSKKDVIVTEVFFFIFSFYLKFLGPFRNITREMALKLFSQTIT
jgi:hypothetical protein